MSLFFRVRILVAAAVLLLWTPLGAVQANLLFHASYDGGVNDADGDFGNVQGEDPIFLGSGNGSGLLVPVDAGRRVWYESEGNLNVEEGSLSLWLYVNFDPESDHPACRRMLFDFQNTFANRLQLFSFQDEAITFTSSADGVTCSVTGGIGGWQRESWKHVVATWSNSRQETTLYVDGVLLDETDAYYPPVSPPARFYIGSTAGGSVAAGTLIDDVRIYDAPLSQAEVLAVRGEDLGGMGAAGLLEPAWRLRPVLGRWLSGGLGLMAVPDYLFETSFPYRSRPHAQEVLFADRLNVVRLLGGWNDEIENGELDGSRDADLAYRGENGQIQYRWELLAPRLDPYVDTGYTSLTIVLDNVPWDLPTTPVLEHFGQAAPPADMAEWTAFIEELCRQLITLYGAERVGAWRFRLGTEMQSDARWTGTFDEYLQFYDHTAAAVHAVLPDAKIGPFNYAGPLTGSNVSYLDLVDHAANGTNRATGERGSPFDFAACSLYSIPKRNDDGTIRAANPEEQSERRISDFRLIEETLGRPISWEIHEYGILENEYGLATDEPGARGGAYHFHALMNSYENGFRSLSHWNVSEEVKASEDVLLRSNGWLYSILDHLAGWEFLALPSPADSENGTVYKSVLFRNREKLMLMASAFNDQRLPDTRLVTLELPRHAIPASALTVSRATWLTTETAVYDAVRRDLDEEGLTQGDWATTPSLALVGTLADMGGFFGREYVAANWSKYEGLMVDSLTLKPSDLEVTALAEGFQITVEMSPPEVLVLELESTAREPLPRAVAVWPPPDSSVEAITQWRISFDRPFLSQTICADAVTVKDSIGSRPAADVRVENETTLVFTLENPASGPATFSVPNGRLVDKDGNAFGGGAWQYTIESNAGVDEELWLVM